jgi:hypothetical protein
MTNQPLSFISKLITVIAVPTVFFGSIAMSLFGYGLSSESDPELLKMYENCQPHERLPNGRCPKPQRSTFNRGFRGGSYGFGK